MQSQHRPFHSRDLRPDGSMLVEAMERQIDNRLHIAPVREEYDSAWDTASDDLAWFIKWFLRIVAAGFIGLMIWVAWSMLGMGERIESTFLIGVEAGIARAEAASAKWEARQ